MRLIFTVLLLFCAMLSFEQTPQDYHNEKLQESQKRTARAILTALENQDFEQAEVYFEESIENLRPSLISISDEILKVTNSCDLSVMVVFDKGYNVIRCRYYNKAGEQYQVDFYMYEGQPKSLVLKMNTKDSKTLAKEKNKRMNKTVPPPPGK